MVGWTRDQSCRAHSSSSFPPSGNQDMAQGDREGCYSSREGQSPPRISASGGTISTDGASFLLPLPVGSHQALPPPTTIAASLYFTSPTATAALDQAIVSALIRMGEHSTAEALSRGPASESSSGPASSQVTRDKRLAQQLQSIVGSIQAGDLQPALQCVAISRSLISAEVELTPLPCPRLFARRS